MKRRLSLSILLSLTGISIFFNTAVFGQTFTTLNSGTTQSLNAISFADINTGFAVGINGVILKTINAGNTWTTLISGTTQNLNDVFVIDPNTVYIVGHNGTIIKTTNGGTTWIAQSSGTTYAFICVWFTDSNTGYAGAEMGTMHKTIDGGNTWTTVSTGHSIWISSLFFPNATTGYCSGSYELIQKTTNSGTSWTQVHPYNLSSTFNLADLFFTDINTGYTVGKDGSIFKITNGGTNYTALNSGTTNYLNSVVFTDANTGYVVGNNGTVVKTTNAGTSWATINSGITEVFSDICFTNASTGYIVGGNGTILKINTNSIENGLVAYYPFNGNANDESVNAKHGIVVNATLTTDRNGVANSAYYFNGVDSYIKVAGAFPITNTFTISFWAFCDNANGYHNILSDGSSNAGGNDFLINFRNNNIGIRADKDAPLNYEDNYPAALTGLDIINKWVQVVWVMNPSSSTIYLNGNQIALINEVGTNQGYHDDFSFIGARQVWGSPDYFFKGKLDDILMYDRALSSTEVNNLYTGSTPQLAVSPNTLTIASQANSTKTFDITSNISWTVASNQTWLTPSSTSGNANATITLTALANTSSAIRTATVTVSGTGVTSKTITVTQEGVVNVLNVSTNTLTIAAPENSTKTFDITSNTNWTIAKNQSWLILSSSSGTGNGTITLTATANTLITTRTAIVIISGTGVTSKTITVTQEGAPPYLAVSTNSLTIGSFANSTKTFVISSNTNWSSVSDQTWLTVSNATGNGNKTITLTATANPTISSRSAQVTVSASGITPQIITVTQIGATPTLTVSTTSITIASPANSTGTFDIKSNTSWTATSNHTWLTLSSETGSGNLTITLTASVNASTSRTAIVTVTGLGLSSRTITVTQTGSIISILSVSPSTITFAATANGVKPLKITSNISWSVLLSNQTWLTVSNTSGAGNKVIQLTALENLSTEARTATVTVMGVGVTSQIVTVTQTGISTDIDNPEISQNINIYPNPSNGLINLSLNNYSGDKITIRINNVIGNVIQELVLENLPSEHNQEMDLSRLAGGVYFVTVQTPKTRQVKSIIISK